MHVWVLGYYDRGNTGDEMYKFAFRRLLCDMNRSHTKENVKLHFVCMDDLTTIPSHVQVVICGGGDIINDYFMEKAVRILKGYTGRVYAISVGIPYQTDATKRYLTLFDHVFVRSRGDYAIACSEIGKKNVTLMGDLCYLVKDSMDHSTNQNQSIIKNRNKKAASNGDPKVYKLGLCLAQPQILKEKEGGKDILHNLATMIKNLTYSLGNDFIELYLIPYNIFKKNPEECDIGANDELEKELKAQGTDTFVKIFNVKTMTKPYQIAELTMRMTATVCMRYHSAVFSKNPILIGNSPKMRRWAADRDMKVISPYRVDNPQLSNVVHIALIFEDSVLQRKANIPKNIPIDYLHRVLFIKPNHQRSLLVPQRTVIRYTFDEVLSYAYATKNAHLVSYLLTGSVNSKMVWGLNEALITRNKTGIYEAIKYVYEDETEKLLNSQMQIKSGREYCPNVQIDRSLGRFQMHPDLGFESYHRTGWPWVTKGLLNAACNSSPDDPFLDPYVDKTFHWGCTCFETLGLIPYRKPWYGILHHTFMEECGPFNCTTLFEKNVFIESLASCICLVTLSEHLAKQVRLALQQIKMDHVRVHSVPHPATPVENTSHMWSLSKWLSTKNVIQIGDWMRDKKAIYQLKLQPKQYFHKILLDPSSSSSSSSSSELVCGATVVLTPSDYIRGGVEVIQYLDSKRYDEVLSCSVVFLKLLDASAVNTVLECIMRHTPVVVNRLPALEEVLGVNYPGFYDTFAEASVIIESVTRLMYCHMQLETLQKLKLNKKLSLEFFVSEIQKFGNEIKE